MTTLLPVHKIKPPQWMQDPDLITILDRLNHDGINARIVGGAIRNFYMSKPVHDIDIACLFTPEKSIKALESAYIKIIPTGLDHGTITAHIHGKNFEITTLRRDIKSDGRHATIAFSTDWTEDARRRDFTINALYADRDGSIYDPLGQGFDDLQNRVVRFIGQADDRIREDYLRILRFFRFYAAYHNGAPDTEAMSACAMLKDKLNTLSDERIYDEIFKILALDNAARAIQAMATTGLFNLHPEHAQDLQRLITTQNQLNAPDITARYNLVNIDKKYIKNKKQNQFIDKINEFIKSWDGDVQKSLYHYDRAVVLQGLLTLRAQGQHHDDITITHAMTMPVPIFPVTASDIMNHFTLAQGPEVGVKMRQAEQIWIDSDFTLPRDGILEKCV